MAQEQGPREFQRRYGQLVARAWSDPEFKRRLTADPVAALAEHGIDVPEGVELQVIEPTAERAYFVLPPKPAAYGELSDEQLADVAGGMGDGSVRSITAGDSIVIKTGECSVIKVGGGSRLPYVEQDNLY